MMIRNFALIIALVLLAACGSNKTNIDTKIRQTSKTNDTIYVEKIIEKEDKLYQAAVLDNYKINDDHFPAQGQDHRQKFLILHYTALHNDASVRVLTQQAVSSHYLVPDRNNDEIHLLVSENKRAWHAGVSEWMGRTNINDSSIGIEIVNLGYSDLDGHMWFYPFSDIQIQKVAALAKNIIERYDIDPTYVLGHSDVAPTRKEDPGAFFPWQKLYEEHGIGAWYEIVDKYEFYYNFPKNDINNYSFIKSVQEDLRKYGYGIEVTGKWDDQTERTLMAFQLHFRPSKYDGKLDADTWAILQALNKKYRN